MGMKRLLVATAATAALVAGAGNALAGSLPSAGAERHGWYFGAEAGWNAVQDSSLPASGYADLQFENNRGYFLTLGHAFEGNWRLELEGGYRQNDLEKYNFLPAPGGDIKEYSGFLNVIKDIPLSKRWLFDLGAGVGFDNVRLRGPFGGLKDGDTVVAAQGIAGLTYRLSNHWDISATYRYLWADDPSLALGPVPKDSFDVTKHTVTLGLRYGYDEPPAPPAPAAPAAPSAPPAPKQFIIFFGFNKCNITAEADAVLSEAASAAKSTGAASVKIVGHTDTVGSAAYNQKLSECRANAAKANLVGKGVSDGAISTSGKGESELMVQTGDGVKEPQNRRATVDLN
jgi:outer membrane protein OmpA-like peptidoglycan-associated protein